MSQFLLDKYLFGNLRRLTRLQLAVWLRNLHCFLAYKRRLLRRVLFDRGFILGWWVDYPWEFSGFRIHSVLGKSKGWMVLESTEAGNLIQAGAFNFFSCFLKDGRSYRWGCHVHWMLTVIISFLAWRLLISIVGFTKLKLDTAYHDSRAILNLR